METLNYYVEEMRFNYLISFQIQSNVDVAKKIINNKNNKRLNPFPETLFRNVLTNEKKN